MRETISRYIAAAQAESSVLFVVGKTEEEGRPELIRSWITEKPFFPLNRSNVAIPNIMQLIDEKRPVLTKKTYWDSRVDYHPVDLITLCSNFFDDHRGRLPLSALPPERDVATYLQVVWSGGQRLTVDEQLRYLLHISHNNLLGAVNIGLIASRAIARNADERAYPYVGSLIRKAGMEQYMKIFSCLFSQFEPSYPGESYDAMGDTYYYWTTLMKTLSGVVLDGWQQKAVKNIFLYGPKAMRFARQYIIHSPTTTSHKSAVRMAMFTSEKIIQWYQNNHHAMA